MATAQPLPAAASAPPPGAPATGRTAGEAVQALVPAPQPKQKPEHAAFAAPIPQLPVELAVSVPVRDFRVRQLLALAPGHVIETEWSHGEDLPLAAGNIQLAWSEFEVVETQLAVRITRLG
jgi:flagellar motor switch/type III secretory pathway protein FliN